MQQYREIKARHQSAILFFRMGDFYEMFYEDAEIGVARARADAHVAQQRRRGRSAARGRSGEGRRANTCAGSCSRAIASRSASRWRIRSSRRGSCGAKSSRRSRRAPRSPTICSTARATTSSARIARDGDERVGIAAADLSTGELRLVRRPRTRRSTRCSRASRRARCSCAQERRQHATARARRRAGHRARSVGVRRSARARRARAPVRRALARGTRHRRADDGRASARRARCCATCASCSPAACRISRVRSSSARRRDAARRDDAPQSRAGGVAARRRLASGTLLAVLDRTLTPMGARLLRQWLLAPLVDRAAIDARLDAVDALARDARRARRAARRARWRARRRALGEQGRGGPRDTARAARTRRFARAASRRRARRAAHRWRGRARARCSSRVG